MLPDCRPILCFLVLALLGLSAASPVLAQEPAEGEFDQLERVRTLQRLAMESSRAGDWESARELAEIVLTLEDGEFTAQSRLILVQALEHDHQYGAALYELGQYLGLPISDANRRKGQRIRTRLQRLHAVESGAEDLRRPRAVPSRAGAVTLLLGGVAASIAGAYFIGTDIYWSSQNVPSGTWAAMGTPILLGGIGLDIAGILLLRSTSPRRRGRAVEVLERSRPSLGLAWDGQRFSFAIGGRW